jgi:hypothetical protein
MAWERNDLFTAITDTAEMTDDTPFHNSTVQWVDLRLIHRVTRQSCYITQKELFY